MPAIDPRLLLLSRHDNVVVVRSALDAGDVVTLETGTARVQERIGLGHKLARKAIARGEKIIKYGATIGSALTDIAPGEHVHLHNVKSDYTPTYALAASEEVPK
ncbi:MAG: UxaA family hydrolase [Paracoccaceae bacterium]|nr:UxaA family hydrolase [Paracoccaceae bacterium]